MDSVGFFDSGIGGLSVLQEAVKILPCENFLYLCDSKNMPYGEKSREVIFELAKCNLEILRECGCKAAVVACNTVTGACIQRLRAQFDFPIVAVEPAITKAKQLYQNNVLVLATTLTSKQKNFCELILKCGKNSFEVVSDASLAKVIEENFENKLNLQREVFAILSNYPKNKSCVVLGCTHYVLIKDMIAHCLQAPTVDGNVETARQLAKVLKENNLQGKNERLSIKFLNCNDKIINIAKNMFINGQINL